MKVCKYFQQPLCWTECALGREVCIRSEECEDYEPERFSPYLPQMVVFAVLGVYCVGLIVYLGMSCLLRR